MARTLGRTSEQIPMPGGGRPMQPGGTQPGATSISFAWEAVAPASSVVSTVWHPELFATLERYLAQAREQLVAGRVEEALHCWEAALQDVPGIPAPRRQAIRQHITDTIYACIRRALQRPVPDTRAAMEWLQRAMRTLGRSDSAEYADMLQAYGVLTHLAGRPDRALRYYRATSPIGPTAMLRYGEALAQLQTSAAVGNESGVDRGSIDPVRARSRAAIAPLGNEAEHPLHAAAWRRLQAMRALLCEGDVEALAGFPPPDTGALPRAWAFEGALLAAMCARWRTSLQYYRRALGTHGFSGLPADALHRYVFLAVALQCVSEGADGPSSMEDVEELVMAVRLPLRPPRHTFAGLASYRAWANDVRRWQYGLLVRRVLQVLPGGDAARLRESLRSMIRLQPHSESSHWIGVWLACTGKPSGAAGTRLRPLRGSDIAERRPQHILRLSALAAERFGEPEHIIARLNRLLQYYPDDAWGLGRWRKWMFKLAEEAIMDGRYKQALFQYTSVVLYAPDDVDGWNGCARVHELLGDDERAADCRRQAEQVQRQRRTRPVPPEVDATADDVEREILRTLLVDANQDPAARAGFPLHASVLRRAVWESLQSPDVYLRVLLERWASGPTNFPNVG